MKKLIVASALLVLLAVLFIAASGQSSRNSKDRDETAETQWEYLVVSGGNLNLSSPGSDGSMRKQPEGAFSREAFVLEKNMDKLGAKGWELVAVVNTGSEPVLYFKRPKTSH